MLDVVYYERRLPHWHPEGVAFFVTWRLCGSPPVTKLDHMEEEGSGAAFVAWDQQLDQENTGPVWMRQPEVTRCVSRVLLEGESEWNLYELRAWVVMPNHVHVLLLPHKSLVRVLQAIKSASARRANRILGRTGQRFWQEESFDRWMRDRDEEGCIARYIDRNPVGAGLARAVGDWPWCSAYLAEHGSAPLGLPETAPHGRHKPQQVGAT